MHLCVALIAAIKLKKKKNEEEEAAAEKIVVMFGSLLLHVAQCLAE